MTTSSDTKSTIALQHSSETNRTKGKENHKTHLPQPTRRNSKHTIALALALIAIGLTLYTLKICIDLRQSTKQQSLRIKAQMTRFKQHQMNEKKELDATIHALNQSKNQLQNKINSVYQQLQSNVHPNSYQESDIILFNVRYYLELAEINAHWGDDLETTAALLHSADTLLVNFHEEDALTLRQQLAKNIADIESIPKIDRAGILSQLDALRSHLNTLPLKPVQELFKDPHPDTQSTPSPWHDKLASSIQLLEKLVIVRHHAQEVLPIPSKNDEAMLREEIRLNLAEAQWAVLQNSDPIYQLSLADAIQNINRSFDPKAPVTIMLINQLNTLQHIHLIQQRPSFDQSLALLNHLIETTKQESTLKGEHAS